MICGFVQYLSFCYFARFNTIHVHPYCCKLSYFILYYGRVVLHCVIMCAYLCPLLADVQPWSQTEVLNYPGGGMDKVREAGVIAVIM